MDEEIHIEEDVMVGSSQNTSRARLGAMALSVVFISAACATGAAPSQVVVAPPAPSVSAAASALSPAPTPSPSSSSISTETGPIGVASCPDRTGAEPVIETGPDATIPTPGALKQMEAFSTDFPQGLAVAAGSIWTANENLDTVTRIDAATGDVTSIKVAPGLGPQEIVESADAVWSAGAGGLVRIDVASNVVDQRVTGCVGSIVSAFGSLWAGVSGGLVRLDPRTGLGIEKVRPNSAADHLCVVSASDDSVWLGCGSELSRIDPTSNHIRATVTTNGADASVFAAEGAAWVITGLDPFAVESPDDAFTALERLDPETNALLPATRMRLVHGAAAPGWLVDGDVVWLSTTFGVGPSVGKLIAFQPASGKVVSAFDISEGKGYGSNAIAFAYGSLWTASGTANAVRRFARPSP